MIMEIMFHTAMVTALASFETWSWITPTKIGAITCDVKSIARNAELDSVTKKHPYYRSWGYYMYFFQFHVILSHMKYVLK